MAGQRERCPAERGRADDADLGVLDRFVGLRDAAQDPTTAAAQAAAVAMSTALPAGIAQVGAITDVLVLLYPSNSGADPIETEYVVLLNAGAGP